MKILKEIGLTERESQIYELLLRIGESPVSAVIKSTKAHPQVVYRVIDSLIDKQLLISIRRKNKIYVSAESPRMLEKLEEDRLKKLHQAIPDLMSLQKTSKEAIVRVSRGDESVRALRLRGIDELKRNETYYIIGGSGDRYYKVMGDFNAEVERKRIKHKIHKKLISFESQKKLLNKNDTFRDLAEFRYLPDDHPIESSTNIFGHTVAIIVWSASPIVITIESEEVAESYKKYFYILWHMAR